jgi:hypothetical protein
LQVHGLVYALEDGLLRRVGLAVDGADSCHARYEASLRAIGEKAGRTEQ